jgi:flagellar motility protein MotE (MotC chaperone)
MIFDPMALDLLLPIVRGMRETKVAAIIAEMDPAKARALTTELARPPESTKQP